MNSQTINEFYGRKSPIFLAQIVTLTSTIIIRTYSSDNHTFNTFTLIVLIVSAIQLPLKGLSMCFNRLLNCENKNFEGYSTIIFILLHIGLLIYGCVLLFNPSYRQKYQRFEPQYFYLKTYVAVYAAIIVGLTVLFAIGGLLGYCLVRKRQNSVEPV